MIDLDPAPNTLGLASPALGPWFGSSSGAGTLPMLLAPAGDLSVAVSLANDQEWRAPAGGLVSYFIATDPRPAGLSRLRAENGEPAFTDGRGVILFTLLPEVELRLHALARSIPAPNDMTVPAAAPTRPRIRWFAFETGFPNLSTLEKLLESVLPPELSTGAESTDAEKAAYLGLSADGGLGNAAKPVTILRRPSRDAVIVRNRTGMAVGGKLWAFDFRGRPVDAGAVAAWWRFLAEEAFTNLWASDDAAEQMTTTYEDAHVIHLVSAHEGPLSEAHKARINMTDFMAVSASESLYLRTGSGPAVALTAASDPDDAPLARLALLPHGTYDAPATNGANLLAQWVDTGWDTVRLGRDFARLALVDVEQQLVGLDRTDPAQASERMRVEARRNNAATPYLSRIDLGTAEIMSILRNGSAASVMAPVMDHDWGALAPPTLGTEAPPERLEFEVRALAGEGNESGGVASDQRVVFILESTEHPLPPGAWVRIWPHGLDTATGRRFPKDGGGGLTDSAGRAHVVVPLPDGSATSDVQMSFEALVVTSEATRFYPEERFDRPDVLAGSRVSLAAPPAVPSGVTLLICETGATMPRGGGGYGGGQTLLAAPSEPAEDYALVDLASLHSSDYQQDTLRLAAGSGDALISTKPAFGATPEGDMTTTGPNGASALYRDRDGLTDSVIEAGRPVPTMERRELAGVDAGLRRGLVGGAPGYRWLHENPPAQLGHAGMPGAPETHGVGVALAGPATVPLVELMRERAASDLLAFVGSAQIAPTEPADPSGPSNWAAILETMTRGVAGDAAMRAFAATDFTPGQAWLDLKSDIETATGQDLDTVIDGATLNDDDLARSLDRMLRKTKEGALQAAVSLHAAIDRAEDFIFIETPSLDALSAASGAVTVVDNIVARLAERRGLCVAVACPERFLPHQPMRLEEVRKGAISAAVKALSEAAPDRVALFTPIAGSDRRLHMATTTVIVDDAYVLTGAAHLWRRGLTFDSALSVSGFDETLSDGRPASIRNLRRCLIAERLALAQELVPDDPRDLILALKRVTAAGGQNRVKPGAFPARDDETGQPTQAAWNPDGGEGGVTNAFLFFAGLSAAVGDEISNAIR